MSTTTFSWMLALVIIVGLFPAESEKWAMEAYAVGYIKFLNGYLMVRSFIVYLRLKRQFAAMGLDIPPFKFVPLQDREEA